MQLNEQSGSSSGKRREEGFIDEARRFTTSFLGPLLAASLRGFFGCSTIYQHHISGYTDGGEWKRKCNATCVMCA